MNLINLETGEKFEGIIEKISAVQVKKLKGNKNFIFDWSLEEGNEVYRIRRAEQEEFLGLISLIDVHKELRIHINLVESSKTHQGKSKEIAGISGCLIGFACQMSFERGYDGFVSLIPKTNLINHYQNKFGFRQMGLTMVVFLEIAQSIITKYLKDGEV